MTPGHKGLRNTAEQACRPCLGSDPHKWREDPQHAPNPLAHPHLSSLLQPSQLLSWGHSVHVAVGCGGLGLGRRMSYGHEDMVKRISETDHLALKL